MTSDNLIILEINQFPIISREATCPGSTRYKNYP